MKPSAPRIGVVSYLNARPLCYGLSDRLPHARILPDVPSRLARDLAEDRLDIALIPSIEYLRAEPGAYAIVPGLSIAARGPVRSVKLFSRVPFPAIKRLALDEGSRTSHALARIWLAEAYHVEPETTEILPLGVSPLESTADAVLVIGDRAMRVPPHAFAVHVDLGAAWFAMTARPFVFALWVARSSFDIGILPQVLADCRANGLAHVYEIATEYGPPLGLDHEACVTYLTRNLSYNLGPDELLGLRLFYEKSQALGLVPEGVDLVFTESRGDLASRR